MTKRLLVKNNEVFIPELTKEIPADGIITVGSEPSSIIELSDQNVASEQFVIVCEDGQITLMSRADGTVVNGETFPPGAFRPLLPGDIIAVGDFTITLESLNGDKPELRAETIANSEIFAASDASVREPATSNQQNATIFEPKKSSEGNLKDILETLRSEEKFYFQIDEAASGENHRVYVESEEMWLGWTTEGNCHLTANAEEIAAPRAQIRKDWTGVLIYPLRDGNVWLNDEPLDEPHRLKNDDFLQLLANDETTANATAAIAEPSAAAGVKFHEPTALLVLDSILPKELPPPVSLDARDMAATEEQRKTPDETTNIHSSRIPPTASVKPTHNNLIFGYFSAGEIIIMALGTLVTAVITFLILELF